MCVLVLLGLLMASAARGDLGPQSSLHSYTLEWHIEGQADGYPEQLDIDVPSRVTRLEIEPPGAVASSTVSPNSGHLILNIDGDTLGMGGDLVVTAHADFHWHGHAKHRHFSATTGIAAGRDGAATVQDSLENTIPSLPVGARTAKMDARLSLQCAAGKHAVASLCSGARATGPSLYHDGGSGMMVTLQPNMCVQLDATRTVNVTALSSARTLAIGDHMRDLAVKTWLPTCICSRNVMCHAPWTEYRTATYRASLKHPHYTDVLFNRPHVLPPRGSGGEQYTKAAQYANDDVAFIPNTPTSLVVAYVLIGICTIATILSCYSVVQQQSFILRDTYGARWLASYRPEKVV